MLISKGFPARDGFWREHQQPEPRYPELETGVESLEPKAGARTLRAKSPEPVEDLESRTQST